MSIPIAISCVSNLTSGGAVVYMKGFLNSVEGVCQFSPRKYYSKRNKIDIDNLNDRYIKELIVKSKGIDVKNITPELIEIYRLQVKLKREIKNARKT